MFWILFIIFFCVLCFAIGWTTLGIIILSAIVLFVIIMIFSAQDQKKREEEQKRKKEEKNNQIQAEKERKSIIYNNSKNELIFKYGEPDKTIVLGELNLDKEIIVFGKVNRIWILGKDLSMNDILNCTFSDNQRVEKGKVSYETKTKTGSMAKRAVVGGVLLGGAGAVIGGSTASKDTIVKQEDDRVIHDYTVIININSLSDPVIRINIGTDEGRVNEIIGLFNVIINRNF